MTTMVIEPAATVIYLHFDGEKTSGTPGLLQIPGNNLVHNVLLLINIVIVIGCASFIRT